MRVERPWDGSLQGTSNVSTLRLTVSITLFDRVLLEKADVQFGDLLEAFGCVSLKSLNITLINDDSYRISDLAPEIEVEHLITQLRGSCTTLEELDISFSGLRDATEVQWLLEICGPPCRSLQDFIALTRLSLPQTFLMNITAMSWNGKREACQPYNLPPHLSSLTIVHPHTEVKEWALGFLESSFSGHHEYRQLKKLILACHDEVGTPACFFVSSFDDIWQRLSREVALKSHVVCQVNMSAVELSGLHLEESGNATEGED